MTKASGSLQKLRRKIYRKAKTDKHWRFWGMYCHICKKEVLEESYRLAKANDGAPGIDGKRFEERHEVDGTEGFLEGIRQGTPEPDIPATAESESRHTERQWQEAHPGNTTIRDRVVQGAAETDT